MKEYYLEILNETGIDYDELLPMFHQLVAIENGWAEPIRPFLIEKEIFYTWKPKCA